MCGSRRPSGLDSRPEQGCPRPETSHRPGALTGTFAFRQPQDLREHWGYSFFAGRSSAGKRIQMTKSGFDTRKAAADALRKAIEKHRSEATGRGYMGGVTRAIPGENAQKVLRAFDAQTGKPVWEFAEDGNGDSWGGVLSAASGLVFYGDDSGGALVASDASNWQNAVALPGQPALESVRYDVPVR